VSAYGGVPFRGVLVRDDWNDTSTCRPINHRGWEIRMG
jgi:hypothetical protein